jgi:hypothetical protein
MRDEWSDQDVADPQLVRPGRLEAAEGAGLASQCGTVEPTLAKMLADGGFGDTDAMPREQDGSDLG